MRVPRRGWFPHAVEAVSVARRSADGFRGLWRRARLLIRTTETFGERRSQQPGAQTRQPETTDSGRLVKEWKSSTRKSPAIQPQPPRVTPAAVSVPRTPILRALTFSRGQ